MKKLPCENCITLSICINRYRIANMAFVSWKMTNFCSILKEYLVKNVRDVDIYDESRRIEFHRFFKGENDE